MKAAPASTGSTCTACASRWRRSSTTSTRSTRTPRRAPASAMAASTTSTSRPTATRSHTVRRTRARTTSSRYYREMYRGRTSSWNLRDTHMADTLDALHGHLGSAGIVVWAHNSHLGDARATSMGIDRGELNLGQLARERHPGEVCGVGFTTHPESATAARDWGAPAEGRAGGPSLDGSIE